MVGDSSSCSGDTDRQTLPLPPAVDVVMCEAARRLHTDHGLSFAEIDSAEVLPRSLVMDDGSIWNPFILRYAR